jgi:hypothetical protein
MPIQPARCCAANNARDRIGAVATSPTESSTLNLRRPTESAFRFAEMVDTLRCRVEYKRVAIPAESSCA